MILDRAERVRFESRTPAGFTDVLAGAGSTAAAQVEGLLVVPETARGPLPLAIMSLGSLGFTSGREELYAQSFAAAGIALLVVDSLGSRGIGETFTDQGRISLATSCADALYALRHMAGDPRFDPHRIALFGCSRGGCAVVLCDDERLANAVLGTRARFAAYVALYPSVWMRWGNPKPAPGPVLVVLGENDIMIPLPLGRARAGALAAAGTRVETVVIEGAFHAFDTSAPQEFKGELNLCDCDVVIADDGSMQECSSGLRLQDDWPGFVRGISEACGKRGVVVGRGPQPQSVAVAPILDFLGRVL